MPEHLDVSSHLNCYFYIPWTLFHSVTEDYTLKKKEINGHSVTVGSSFNLLVHRTGFICFDNPALKQKFNLS